MLHNIFPAVVHSFVVDEQGQDLVEYALLTALIGFAGFAAFDLIQTAIGAAYGSWETETNDAWHPADPISAGS